MLSNDTNNCGTCGNVCGNDPKYPLSSSPVCLSGSCAATNCLGLTNASQCIVESFTGVCGPVQCVINCINNTTCPSNSICVNNVCTFYQCAFPPNLALAPNPAYYGPPLCAGTTQPVYGNVGSSICAETSCVGMTDGISCVFKGDLGVCISQTCVGTPACVNDGNCPYGALCTSNKCNDFVLNPTDCDVGTLNNPIPGILTMTAVFDTVKSTFRCAVPETDCNAGNLYVTCVTPSFEFGVCLFQGGSGVFVCALDVDYVFDGSYCQYPSNSTTPSSSLQAFSPRAGIYNSGRQACLLSECNFGFGLFGACSTDNLNCISDFFSCDSFNPQYACVLQDNLDGQCNNGTFPATCM